MARELHHGLDLNGNPIVGLPATPTAADEAASKAYVDSKAAGGGLDQTAADARYVNIDGDTMTGDLSVPDGMVIGNTVRAQINAGLSTPGIEIMGFGQGVRLESAGGTLEVRDMDGAQRVQVAIATPELAAHAATKAYVDDANTAHTAAADPHTGYVKGPASATSQAIARFSGTTGKLLSNAASSPTIQDDGKLLVNAMQGAPLMVYNSSGEPHIRCSGSGISLFSATTIVDVNARAVLGIANATIVPAADVAGAAQLFVEGGVLKARYADAAGNGAIPRVIVGGTKPTAPAVGTIWVPAG